MKSSTKQSCSRVTFHELFVGCTSIAPVVHVFKPGEYQRGEDHSRNLSRDEYLMDYERITDGLISRVMEEFQVSGEYQLFL
nr:hypothetical protein [Candidatus Sigynarchaeota archaeon]